MKMAFLSIQHTGHVATLRAAEKRLSIGGCLF